MFGRAVEIEKSFQHNPFGDASGSETTHKENFDFFLTMNIDIIFPVCLSCHIYSDTGVSSGVSHLSILDA